jgi:hypothetical protein
MAYKSLRFKPLYADVQAMSALNTLWSGTIRAMKAVFSIVWRRAIRAPVKVY